MTGRRSFPAELASATEARHYVAGQLDSWGVPGATDDAALLTTEVVRNAIAHAGSAPTVTVTLDDGRVRIAVQDDSPELPYLPDRRPGAPSGRGLLIVNAIASDWGVLPSGGGKEVWFEVPSA